MLFDNLRHQFGGDEVVGDGFLPRENDVDQHVVGAQTAATGLLDFTALADLGRHAEASELILESLGDLQGTRGDAAGSGADQYLDVFRGFGHIWSSIRYPINPSSRTSE